MSDDRTPGKIAVEMEPLILKISNAYRAAYQARRNSDTLLYILSTIKEDAENLKQLWRELYDMTHKSSTPLLKAVEE